MVAETSALLSAETPIGTPTTNLTPMNPDTFTPVSHLFFVFFFTLVTGPRRFGSHDTKECEPEIRAHLGTTAKFCKAAVLRLRAGVGVGAWGVRRPARAN